MGLKLDHVHLLDHDINNIFNHSENLITFLQNYMYSAYGFTDNDNILINYFDNKELAELVVAYQELLKTQKFTIKILTGNYGYLKKIHTYANDNSTYDLACGALTGGKSEHFTKDEIRKLQEKETGIRWYSKDVLIESVGKDSIE